VGIVLDISGSMRRLYKIGCSTSSRAYTGFALVATADGVLDQSVRQKIHEFVNQSEELRAFGQQQVMNRFDYFVNLINRDRFGWKAGAFRAPGKVRH
jgi:tellurite resistance protein